MKNKAGIIIGFITGMIGFLVLFKIFILDRVPAEEELAPGIVVIASIMSGMLFAFAGHSLQHYLEKKV